MIVLGAGMAGLCTAARARQLGKPVRLLEKGDRPGGSMLLSSGFVWRYRTLELFREQCPLGDAVLQELVHERLDDALAWLASLGAQVLARDSGNPLTSGWRFDTHQLTEALVRAGGEPQLGATASSTDEALVLATGGFQGDRDLVEELIAPAGRLPLRANPWSAGDGLRLARARGAALAGPLGEFYGRAMPAVETIPPERFVGAAQLYGRFARVHDLDLEPLGVEPSWSELDLVQAIARRREGRAWYVLDRPALRERVRERTVGKMVAVADELGAPVVAPVELGLEGEVAVQVEAWITHTIGGLAVDADARVLDEAGAPLDGLFAAGVDAGGISGGGYASGLATALVLGLVAAENA